MHKAFSFFEQLFNLLSAFQPFFSTKGESFTHFAKIKSPVSKRIQGDRKLFDNPI